MLDYSLRRGGCAYYVLDGRGQRDINQDSYRILGQEQFERFAAWARALDPEGTAFLFVVSAVPVLHTRAGLVNADEQWLVDHGGVGDDLRDSWEHELHDEERGALMEALFEATARGIRVCILSGDVHVSAVFSIEDADGHRIYQLTSSAITYGLSRPVSWVLSQGAAEDGETTEGHRFDRLALYAESSDALISADPRRGECWFKFYEQQKLEPPPSLNREATVPLNHSVAKIRLFYDGLDLDEVRSVASAKASGPDNPVGPRPEQGHRVDQSIVIERSTGSSGTKPRSEAGGSTNVGVSREFAGRSRSWFVGQSQPAALQPE